MEYVFFLYSQSAFEKEKKIAEALSTIHKPQKVLSEGKWKIFTHKTKDVNQVLSLFSDAIIIAKLKKDDMKII